VGNVRPMYIKRVALELVQKFPDRNRIAGYIAKIMEKPKVQENEIEEES